MITTNEKIIKTYTPFKQMTKKDNRTVPIKKSKQILKRYGCDIC